MIPLGHAVKDKITGFIGIAYAKTEWLIGCTRIGVKSQELHEGKPMELEWFDEPQLTDLGETGLESIGSSNLALAKAKTGGPRPDPKY